MNYNVVQNFRISGYDTCNKDSVAARADSKMSYLTPNQQISYHTVKLLYVVHIIVFLHRYKHYYHFFIFIFYYLIHTNLIYFDNHFELCVKCKKKIIKNPICLGVCKRTKI